jgi:glutamate N-acetyltransferase/amino-acid N-acetyltransferase
VSVVAPQGFVAGGAACGVKESGVPDLAIVATADGTAVTAAGVFTTNLACAAPVQISRLHLADGRAAAIVLNSGNANAATGAAGRAVAKTMAALTAAGIGAATEDVLVCSTGLIGIPLSATPFESGIPKLCADLAADAAHGAAAAQAILTTDTVRKEAVATATIDGITVTVGGLAKGAAMLSPAMATMLAAVTTDAAIEADALQAALVAAVDGSFNSMIVDGCTSTNDTVLVLASGAAGHAPITATTGAAFHAFADALATVCQSLARQMAADAEGATKLATIEIRGARSDAEARLAARTVANSNLVKCSLYGQDPYWGRVLSELGASGAMFDPELTTIAYDGVVVCDKGIAAEHDVGAVARTMAAREITVTCDLHNGVGRSDIITSDLTHGYIDENMGTS